MMLQLEMFNFLAGRILPSFSRRAYFGDSVARCVIHANIESGKYYKPGITNVTLQMFARQSKRSGPRRFCEFSSREGARPLEAQSDSGVHDMTIVYLQALYLSLRAYGRAADFKPYPMYADYGIYGACYLSTIEFQIVDFAL